MKIDTITILSLITNFECGKNEIFERLFKLNLNLRKKIEIIF